MGGVMAKSTERQNATARAGKAGATSPLGAAFAAYQAGDMVTARKLAKAVVAQAESADQDAAKRVGQELMTSGDAGSTPAYDAVAVATELIARTKPIPKTFAVAGVAAVVWVLLAFFASTRS